MKLATIDGRGAERIPSNLGSGLVVVFGKKGKIL